MSTAPDQLLMIIDAPAWTPTSLAGVVSQYWLAPVSLTIAALTDAAAYDTGSDPCASLAVRGYALSRRLATHPTRCELFSLVAPHLYASPAPSRRRRIAHRCIRRLPRYGFSLVRSTAVWGHFEWKAAHSALSNQGSATSNIKFKPLAALTSRRRASRAASGHTSAHRETDTDDYTAVDEESRQLFFHAPRIVHAPAEIWIDLISGSVLDWWCVPTGLAVFYHG
ncbi:hypothetical protein C8R47DRAFT_1210769 [Mycena vitilis]|nr:hypothetical protein C8R47DRAFT_1210769 [Mycena vitilis]